MIMLPSIQLLLLQSVLGIPEVEYRWLGLLPGPPQCLREVTLTCNALEFNSPIISWFAGDTVLARYYFIVIDEYPRVVRTDSTNATAQISYANFTTTFNYFNFTLSVKVNQLIPFQGQNFTCGTTSMRSSAIPVDNLKVLGKII